MIKKIIQPDTNNYLLKKYHTSGKLLIPLLIPSLILNNLKIDENLQKFFNTVNVFNIGYHSYVSTSCVITDYIKPKHIANFSRITNFNFHGIAVIGLINYIFKSK